MAQPQGAETASCDSPGVRPSIPPPGGIRLHRRLRRDANLTGGGGKAQYGVRRVGDTNQLVAHTDFCAYIGRERNPMTMCEGIPGLPRNTQE